jgi:asparagine synthase (glutamine-hydrolysing)
MSGFAGIVNADGAPIRRELLDRMANFLGEWGPDASAVWTQGSIGLVHTLLRATPESERERQPASLDGETWIVADARIDARENLLADLRGRGRDCAAGATEPELLLHAYAAWGEACVEHLLGDFAFAIWDGRNRRLFCARDHFGVKPFFYARAGDALVFSNAIDCPRLHPDVPHDVYELAIADFLILGYNHDVERTAIAAVRRLAPAHVLIADESGLRTRRYWSLPADPPTVFRHQRDYVERFRDLFGQAVRDRLRTKRAAVLMSGGLDSSSVAAMTKHVLAGQGGVYHMSVHTCTYDTLVPYDDGRYAKLVADSLGIDWRPFPLDNMKLLDLWDSPAIRCPEPEKMRVFSWRLSDMLGNPRPGLVVLTGQGGDVVFSSYRKQHCRNLIKQHRWWQLTRDVGRYLLSEGRLKRLHLTGYLRERAGKRPPRRPFPEWINPDLSQRLNLTERYKLYEADATGRTAPSGAVRPEACEGLNLPLWPSIFEEYTPDAAGAAIEARHPFFDLRLVHYLLSLPALPWCSDKELLRCAMRGLLPNEVRLRRKEAVPVNYLQEHYRKSPKPWLEKFEPTEELSRYVDIDLAMQYLQDSSKWNVVVHLRPLCLDSWLKWESRFAYKLQREESRVETH